MAQIFLFVPAFGSIITRHHIFNHSRLASAFDDERNWRRHFHAVISRYRRTAIDGVLLFGMIQCRKFATSCSSMPIWDSRLI